MDLVKFWTVCSSNSIILENNQIQQFERFENELRYWNEKVNLISRKDEENIFERHILHSLAILKYIDLKPKAKCLDFGTGGGFPGIPLKIARPDLSMLLVDSIKKKGKITEMFAKHTGLKEINFKIARVEELQEEFDKRIEFDYIFARAVGRLEVLVDLSHYLLKKGGKMIFLKGGNLEDEFKKTKERFQYVKIDEINIKLIGADWFEKEEKKIITVSF